ncbi:agmatine/peptidylarginine deiminase [Haliscomenobacter sp.]|uniref:agmatine deiminase family protein n=1 Tax=Haliscomenobacter sp. TaxID=2717303 RepID=UPI0035938608
MTRRLPAEWEPQSAVQFTFPHAETDWANSMEEVLPCFVEAIEIISRYEKVLVVCRDQNEVRPHLKNAVQENLILVDIPSNDTWARDHGGITIFEDSKPLILDFVFTGWGLKFPAFLDNLITGRLQQQGIFKAPLQHGGLALEGGGIESDGQGTLLTTSECLLSPNRNPHLDQAATEVKLKELFGLERVLWLHHGYLAGDDTDSHIDTLARFCSVDTIAYVQCLDTHDEHYEALRAMEKELQAFTTVEGKPYQLIPLPMATACFAEDGHRLPATYANFLIINQAVLVPTYQVPEDKLALVQIQKAFPNHAVIGINCRALIEQHGSLHCISMQYPANCI